MTGPRRAPAPPLRLRLRSGTAARRPISYQSKDSKPDSGWGHFKPPRRGHCRPPRRDGDEWLPDWATKHRLLHGVLWWVSTGVIGVWFGPVIAVGWSLGWPLAVFGVAAAHGGITLRGRNAIDPMRHESEPPVGCPPSEVRQVGRAVRAAEQSLLEIAPKIQATS